MRDVAGMELEGKSSISNEIQQTTLAKQQQTASVDDIFNFTCSICNLKERYDYKGAKPPFARQLLYFEESYIMRDPFSLPNKGEALVLGADCSKCKRAVCFMCSIYYAKRFCLECALSDLQNLPFQLHGKIRSLTKTTEH